MGASSGGIEALPRVIGGLSADFPGSVFVVQHISPDAESILPGILSRSARLKAIHPTDRQRVKCGLVYVAPPDHHLWLEDSCVRVTRGPRINRHRPAVDVLFESAAHVYHRRVVGVILTGALGDGAAGLYTVKKCGGVAIVQDPRDALVPSMPENAMRYVQPDHVLPLNEIPTLLQKLSRTKPGTRPFQCPKIRFSMEKCTERPDEMERQFGPPTSVICPDCGGPLWELRDGKMSRYRCLTGHVFSPESLLEGEKEELERALWTATKTLEERSSLLRNLAREAHDNKQSRAAKALETRAKRLEQNAESVRRIVKKLDPT